MKTKVHTKSELALFESGLQLFNQFGIKKVSIQEIAEQAGVSKMTFYRAFENKEDFLLQLVKYRPEFGSQDFENFIESDSSFMEKMEKIIEMKKKSLEATSTIFIQEIVTMASLAQYFRELKVRMHAKFMNAIEMAKEKGEISAKFDSRIILFLIDNAESVVNHPVFESVYQGNYAKETEDLMELFLYGIVGKRS